MANDTDNMKVISLTDSNLYAGETVELDFTQNPWEFRAPAPRGIYDIKLYPGKDTFRQLRHDNKVDWNVPGNAYYMASIEGHIVGTDWDDSTVFVSVFTSIGKGRAISTMVGLILRAGFQLKNNKLNDITQCKTLEAALKKEPIVKGVLLDWVGYSKTDKSNVYRSMVDFPKNSDGTYQHIVDYVASNRLKEEIRANLHVKDWNPMKDAGKGTRNSNSAPVVPTAPIIAPPEIDNLNIDDQALNDLLA